MELEITMVSGIRQTQKNIAYFLSYADYLFKCIYTYDMKAGELLAGAGRTC